MDKVNEGQAKLFGENGQEGEEEQLKETSRGRQDKKQREDNNGCDFCAIVKNEVARHIVFQDSVSVAFLDRKPVFLGHCLLVPNIHYETISDLPGELVGPLFANVQLLVKAVHIGLQTEGTFVAINNKVSQSVPHLHIHVVPRRFKDGLRGFFWPRQKYQSEEQMVEICNSIRAAAEKIRLTQRR